MFTRDTKIEFVRECLSTYHCTFGKLEAWRNSDVIGVSLNMSDPVHMAWVVSVQTSTSDRFFDLVFDAPFDLKSGAFGDMLAKQWVEFVVGSDFVNETGLSFITMYRERMVHLFKGVANIGKDGAVCGVSRTSNGCSGGEGQGAVYRLSQSAQGAVWATQWTVSDILHSKTL